MRNFLMIPGALLILVAAVMGDEFEIAEEGGEVQKIEARLVAAEEGISLLELPDGQYEIIPTAVIRDRKIQEGPAPLNPEQIQEALTRKFGDEKFRSLSSGSFVIGLILAAPIPKNAESRATVFMKKAAAFMTRVETKFKEFLRSLKIAFEEPTHPLVVLIFESDSDFEEYSKSLGTRGLSAGIVAGFYYQKTNYLAIRMTECETFEVPLHEAIHQQCFNRGILNRFAPIPAWFLEGMATGFETTNTNVTSNPIRVSSRYASQAFNSNQFDWTEMARNDAVFRGDILASEAYGQGWGMHWLAVSKYKDGYVKYLKLLSEKSPLKRDTPEERLADWETAFGIPIQDFESEFPKQLSLAAKRQKVNLDPAPPPGYSKFTGKHAFVEVSAVNQVDKGYIEAEGELTCISPIRPLSYHVCVISGDGTYCDWYFPEVAMRKKVSLPLLPLTKQADGTMFGNRGSFRVIVNSAVPDSVEGMRWKSGRLPVPRFDR